MKKKNIKNKRYGTNRRTGNRTHWELVYVTRIDQQNGTKNMIVWITSTETEENKTSAKKKNE